MASWTAIPTSVLEVGKPVRSIDLIALRDNITAAFEKASGAPVLANSYVVEAMLAASSVAQGKLKSTTAAGSVAVGSAAAGSYTLTGGTYSWWTGSADSPAPVDARIHFGNQNTGAGVIGLYNNGGDSGNFYVDERYIQASPPYNLGHGDIPLFVFVMLDALSKIRGVSVAPDPTWAYHGPTDIRPERIDKDGRAFRRYCEVAGLPLGAALKRADLLQQIVAGDIEIVMVEREITHELKNADMDLFPHPWVGNDLTGLTVIMLDPLSSLVERLALIHADAGATEIRRLVEKGYIELQATPLGTTTPAGVMPVAASWKASAPSVL